ncbi:hypothetical protein LTR10_004845 [Elasticomyces elasticus]|nr:hypothetical protein LTR10_004845 [Elasticomyces elasticus]
MAPLLALVQSFRNFNSTSIFPCLSALTRSCHHINHIKEEADEVECLRRTKTESMDLGQLDVVSTTTGLHLALSSFVQFSRSEERLTIDLTDDELPQLWQQLRLSATSVEATASDKAGLHLITISLSHRELDAEQQRRCLHKLKADVPYYDTQPPAGTRTRTLEVVHLAMKVTCPQIAKRQRHPNEIRSLTCSPSAVSSDLTTATDMLFDDSSTDTDLFDDMILESFDDHLVGQNQTMSSCTALTHDETPHHLESPYRGPSMPSSGAEPDVHAEYNTEAILELINTSVRMAISENVKPSNKSIHVRGGKNLRRLQAIAPTIWTPGYLPSVASQAVFLPTISHALDAVARASAPMAHLREGRTYDRQGSLSVHLWQLLQHGECFSPKTKRLKSLIVCSERDKEVGMYGLEPFELDHERDELLLVDGGSDWDEAGCDQLDEDAVFDDFLLERDPAPWHAHEDMQEDNGTCTPNSTDDDMLELSYRSPVQDSTRSDSLLVCGRHRSERLSTLPPCSSPKDRRLAETWRDDHEMDMDVWFEDQQMLEM